MEEYRVFQINLTNFFKANPDESLLPIALEVHLSEQLLNNLIPSIFEGAVMKEGAILAYGKGQQTFEFEGIIFKCAFDRVSGSPIFRIEFPKARRNASNQIEAVRRIRNALLKVENGVKLEALTKPSMNTARVSRNINPPARDSRKNSKPPARVLRA